MGFSSSQIEISSLFYLIIGGVWTFSSLCLRELIGTIYGKDLFIFIILSKLYHIHLFGFLSLGLCFAVFILNILNQIGTGFDILYTNETSLHYTVNIVYSSMMLFCLLLDLLERLNFLKNDETKLSALFSGYKFIFGPGYFIGFFDFLMYMLLHVHFIIRFVAICMQIPIITPIESTWFLFHLSILFWRDHCDDVDTSGLITYSFIYHVAGFALFLYSILQTKTISNIAEYETLGNFGFIFVQAIDQSKRFNFAVLNAIIHGIQISHFILSVTVFPFYLLSVYSRLNKSEN